MPKQIAMRAVVMSAMLAASMPSALSQGPRVVRENAVVCKSRDTLNRFIDLKIQKDQVALDKLAQQAWASGECKMFKGGDEVFIEEMPFLSGIIKVRKKGDIDGYWIIYESLRK